MKFGIPGKSPPTKCPVCKCKLSKPIYKQLFAVVYCHGDHWRVECKCGVYLRWTFPGVWVVRHELPLWDRTYGRKVA